ncbi:hypothetical protein AKJ16_DCAP03329 [Drosera capensis]
MWMTKTIMPKRFEVASGGGFLNSRLETTKKATLTSELDEIRSKRSVDCFDRTTDQWSDFSGDESAYPSKSWRMRKGFTWGKPKQDAKQVKHDGEEDNLRCRNCNLGEDNLMNDSPFHEPPYNLNAVVVKDTFEATPCPSTYDPSQPKPSQCHRRVLAPHGSHVFIKIWDLRSVASMWTTLLVPMTSLSLAQFRKEKLGFS